MLPQKVKHFYHLTTEMPISLFYIYIYIFFLLIYLFCSACSVAQYEKTEMILKRCSETENQTQGDIKMPQTPANFFLVVNPATSRLMEINSAARNQTAKNRKFEFSVRAGKLL